jgi:two-component system OmpR family response regulator
VNDSRHATASGQRTAPGLPGAVAFLSRFGRDGEQHGPSTVDRSSGERRASASLRVFLVEDNALIRDNLSAALEELAPVTVIGHAEGCAEAVCALGASDLDCDLAIVDVFLKEGSGIGVLGALGQARRPIRCVVLTNYATAAIRAQCLALGAEAVFDKSSEIDALVDYCAGCATRGRHDA